jgi:hypothetical protein
MASTASLAQRLTGPSGRTAPTGPGPRERGGRRLDEPTPSEIRQLMTHIKTHTVTRRNARGGRSAEEHLVAALRACTSR